MIPQPRIALTAAKLLFCAFALCLCILFACLIFAPAQSSGHAAAHGSNSTSLASDPEPTENTPSNQSRGADEEELSPSEQPGTADQHNSTGDDIVVRVRR
jgi:hypothetical protein